MALDFFQPYLVERVSSDDPAPWLVIGVRPATLHHPETGADEEGFAMLLPGCDLGRTIRGTLIMSTADLSMVCDARPHRPPSAPALYIFRPLTLARLREVGKLMTIGDFEQLLRELRTDEDVALFYRRKWLYAYWVERWDRERSAFGDDKAR